MSITGISVRVRAPTMVPTREGLPIGISAESIQAEYRAVEDG
jgi:hypothetical protein